MHATTAVALVVLLCSTASFKVVFTLISREVRTCTCLLPLAADGRVASLQRQAPNIDVAVVNCYGCANTLCADLQLQGFTGRYVLGEYGTQGYWEVPNADNGTPSEPTSTAKALSLITAFNGGGVCNAPESMGAFAFYSGYKIEGTPSWFSLFDEAGNAAGDRFAILSSIWRGTAPPADANAINGYLADNGVPQVTALQLSATHLAVGQPFDATSLVMPGIDTGAAGYSATFRITAETATQTSYSASTDTTPPPVFAEIQQGSSAGSDTISARMIAPMQGGQYRAYVYLKRSGNPGFATANVPITVA